MEWRLYYWTPDDGVVILTSSECSWADAPSSGVQVLTWNEGHGWNIEHGIEDYRLPAHVEIKRGRLSPDTIYEATVERAYADIGAARA